MSSVAIARQILTQYAALTAQVPAARIIAGQVPQGTAMPAIGVHEISGYPLLQTTTRRTPTETMRSRVQVTVLSKSYPDMKKILLLVKKAFDGNHTGVVLGYQVNSARPDNIGPEIPPADDGIFEQSRDFIVTFAEAN